MFEWFRRKKDDASANAPAAEKLAKISKAQEEIAELQSQISELRRQSTQINAEIARRLEERAGLMAKIPTVPEAQKTALALRVKNIDRFVAARNKNLALIEQQIGNNETIIVQIGGLETIGVGDVVNVIDMGQHKKDMQDAADAKNNADINVEISEGMYDELTGGDSVVTSDLAGILAEAEGARQSTTTQPPDQHSTEAVPPQRPMSAGQY